MPACSAAVLHGVDDLRVQAWELPGEPGRSNAVIGYGAERVGPLQAIPSPAVGGLLCRAPQRAPHLHVWSPINHGVQTHCSAHRCHSISSAAGPAQGCVRVRVRAVGICGSDVHYWKRVSPALGINRSCCIHVARHQQRVP